MSDTTERPTDVVERQLVCSSKQAMEFLDIKKNRLFDLISAGELESYLDGGRRKITTRSIRAYIDRSAAADAKRRGRAA